MSILGQNDRGQDVDAPVDRALHRRTNLMGSNIEPRLGNRPRSGIARFVEARCRRREKLWPRIWVDQANRARVRESPWLKQFRAAWRKRELSRAQARPVARSEFVDRHSTEELPAMPARSPNKKERVGSCRGGNVSHRMAFSWAAPGPECHD